jgi:type II secretory pathway pseudopilin PulG
MKKESAMKLQRSQGKQTFRTAFTLVELLVVIAIIIVLVSLLMVGVFKALDSAYQAQTRTDITQIAAAIESFKTKYAVSYIPSRIILCKDYLNYFTNRDPQQGALTPFHQDSLDYLTKIFPRIASVPPGQSLPIWALPPFPAWAAPAGTYTGIDWNLSGQPDQLTPFVMSCPVGNAQILGSVLEGEQCLVFFAGGIPNSVTNTVTGFSTNATNPAAGGDRVPPFFDFKSSRLTLIPGTAPGFPCYQDGYGKTPYAFFSSYKSTNGYNRYVNYSNPYIAPIGSGAPVTSDCQALYLYGIGGLPVFPYCQSGMYTAPQVAPGVSPVYLNPQTYQIISAGKDNIFGNGTVVAGYPGAPAGNAVWVYNSIPNPGLWNPSNASAFYLAGTTGGADDVANFYDRLLGVPTQ